MTPQHLELLSTFTNILVEILNPKNIISVGPNEQEDNRDLPHIFPKIAGSKHQFFLDVDYGDAPYDLVLPEHVKYVKVLTY
jgi:hypothetical protein